MHIFRI